MARSLGCGWDSPPDSKPAPKKKRSRATVIAEKDGRVLLIRERGSLKYSLPGGGIERGEYTMEAALRELREETKLRPFRAERLFDYEGTTQLHKVVVAQVRGEVRLQRKEVSEYKWWDGKEQFAHAPVNQEHHREAQESTALGWTASKRKCDAKQICCRRHRLRQVWPGSFPRGTYRTG